MKKFLLLASFLTLSFTSPAEAAPDIGTPAPAFTASDLDGKIVTLEAYKGKTTVLEWTNHECPFVRKHYGSQNMQTLQKYAAGKDVVWISVVSSAPGKQGHTTAEEAKKILMDQGAVITHKVLDETGAIGRLYGSETTPHMFVIAPDGTLAYKGAIDSDSSPRPSSVEGATNYVRAAIDALAAGRPVAPAETDPYGCSVKY